MLDVCCRVSSTASNLSCLLMSVCLSGQITRRGAGSKTSDNSPPKNAQYTRGVNVQQVNISGTLHIDRQTLTTLSPLSVKSHLQSTVAQCICPIHTADADATRVGGVNAPGSQFPVLLSY